MKCESTSIFNTRRVLATSACVLVLAFAAPMRALTPSAFDPVQTQLVGDIATLTANPMPTRAELVLLKTLGKATNILATISLDDGKALGKLNTLLKRNPNYTNQLTLVASNLLLTFNTEYDFVGGTVIPEIPPGTDVTTITAQYNKLAPISAKLNASTTVAKCAALYDSAKRKLDTVFFAANQLLNFPFPSDLQENTVVAKIDGIGFRASAATATDNFFDASATENNINVTVSGLVRSSTTNNPHGILFSVPNASFGTFRYAVPDMASFTNRTEVYSDHESNVAATNGVIFISTTTNEVYGIFQCSGPGFNVTDGRFRITISRQP